MRELSNTQFIAGQSYCQHFATFQLMTGPAGGALDVGIGHTHCRTQTSPVLRACVWPGCRRG